MDVRHRLECLNLDLRRDLLLEAIDARVEYGEVRTQVIGISRGNILFVVTTSPREDVCRIISARKATRDEQDRYYAGDRETW